MKRPAKFQDLTNETFGRLKVLFQSSREHQRDSLWVSECLCGTIREFRGSCLRTGATKSCGCLRKELAAARVKAGICTSLTHGCAARGNETREHRAWSNARLRYADVPSFEEFLVQVGPKPNGRARLRRQPDRSFIWTTKFAENGKEINQCPT